MSGLSGRARVLAAVVAAVALFAGVAAVALTLTGDDGPRSGDVPFEALALPEGVNAPGTWSDDEGTDGPVAAVGLSLRTVPEGVTGDRQSLEPFAVSAVDGHATWLDLPGIDLENDGFVGQFALSPDGRWIGWSRHREVRRKGRSSLVGWAVMNTTTGEIRELEDVAAPRVRPVMADLAFSGDSRYLLTSYEIRGRPARRGHQFVAWDVEDETQNLIEKPGKHWLPNVGSSPDAVVWARGRHVYRLDLPTGSRSSITVLQRVVAASWGPDDTAFAYIGAPTAKGSEDPWRLYAGRTLDEARGHAIRLPDEVDPSQLLGWVDERHVVVGHYRDTVHIVDVVSGDVVEQSMAGRGKQLNLPVLAADLWQHPLAEAVAPNGTADPRRPWRWVSGALVVLLAGGLLVLRWRRGRSTSGSPVGASASEAPRPETTTVGQQHDYPAYGGPVYTAPPLRPLATAATGLLLVVFDVRFQGVDVIPDPIGWAMAGAALASLATVHRGFHIAGIAAWLAVIPALPDWFGVENSLIAIAIAVALLVTEFEVCTAVMAVSPARAASASTIRWLTLALSGALALAIVAASAEPEVGVIALVIGLAELVVGICFLVLLYGVANETPPSPAERLDPQNV
ncbi:hypothetical protein BH09ACT12_BH09ACT12_04620 [soil metagenome]